MVEPPPSPDDHAAHRAWCEALGLTYLPGFVQRMPTWNPAASILPCCQLIVVEPDVPSRAGNCPACGDRFWVRTCGDGVRRILTESAMIEVECLAAEAHIEATAIVCTVTPIGGTADALDDALVAARRIARGRVLHRHGRGPEIRADGTVVEG